MLRVTVLTGGLPRLASKFDDDVRAIEFKETETLQTLDPITSKQNRVRDTKFERMTLELHITKLLDVRLSTK